DRILLVGDVMYDAALYYGAKAERKSQILQQSGLRSKQYILATIHRAENTDDARRLQNIFEGLGLAAKEIPVIIPLHPRTREALKQEEWVNKAAERIVVIEPVGYLDMVMLEKHSRLIATDSGGVQKEAFFYDVPCVTLRSETEWVELVELGWNRVVPPLSATAVRDGVQASLDGGPRRDPPTDLYGGGRAAERIVQTLAGAGGPARPARGSAAGP